MKKTLRITLLALVSAAALSANAERWDVRDYVTLPDPLEQVGGTCWAYASAHAVMANWAYLSHLADPDYDEYPSDSVISAEHIVAHHGYNKPGDEGGNVWMCLGYYGSGQGPKVVNEIGDTVNAKYYVGSVNSVPYMNDSESLQILSVALVKMLLKQYGAVSMSLKSAEIRSPYYDKKNNSAYLPLAKADVESAYHAGVIIGYDDDFNDFDNLAEKPSAPGAWIVENSYGPDSNDGGCYYLSYYSGTMRNPSVYMSRIERGAVDTIMMKDRLGFVSATNFSNNIVTLHSYFANPQGSEIRAVGIYTTQVTTKVNVSLVKGSYPGDASEPLLSKDTVLAFAGYHVIGVCPTFFAAGDSIGLVVRYEQNESKNVSIPFERSNSSGTAIVENVGDQYIKNGDVWHNVGIVWPDANLLTKLYCKNIQAVNAVDEAQASGNVGLRAWASGGSDITIEVCAPSEVAVYDMCGKLVENVNVDWRKTVQVPSGGVYIVTSNGESVKVQK